MRKVFWILAVLCIGFGLFNAGQVYLGYKMGQDEYESLKETFIIKPMEIQMEKEKEASPDTEEVKSVLSLPDDVPFWNSIDFTGLKEISDDVVAWIEIPVIDASYPVMQANDNEYYLHRDISGEYLFAGSIFMDAFNDPGFRNMNTIIYGHNMNDRSMFGKLREFRNQEIYDECPYFWIYTEECSYLYQIFSVHLASNGSSTFIVKFVDAANFEKWLIQMKDISEIECEIVPNITDQIVTLSTCTGNSSEKQVVQGMLIAEIRNDEVTRIR